MLGNDNFKKTLSIADKNTISIYWDPLIQEYKELLKSIQPDKRYNYVVDIYSKWYRHYFYFCMLYQADFPNRIKDNFEVKYLRMECISNDKCNLSYFRHTNQWLIIAENITFETCSGFINDMSILQPDHFF